MRPISRLSFPEQVAAHQREGILQGQWSGLLWKQSCGFLRMGGMQIVNVMNMALVAGAMVVKNYDPEKVKADYEAALAAWEKKAAEINGSNKSAEKKQGVPRRPRQSVSPALDSGRAAAIYNGMIHPWVGYALTGAIWYQGESNASRAKQYSSKAVPQPVAVRYAWASNPEGANLVNGAGLPASLFRTDDWKLKTE